jgi:mannose-6-phosphate isomerase-like protein (cupin superfamily)
MGRAADVPTHLPGIASRPMSNYTIKHIDELAALHHGAVKLVAAELGVESFGLQILEFPAGFADYPEHDHAEDGQEEVYVVLEGSGQFMIDGDAVPVDPAHFLRVPPGARRKLIPGPGGVRLLAVGCSIDQPYERPDGFQLAVNG